LEASASVSLSLRSGRQAYAIVMEGDEAVTVSAGCGPDIQAREKDGIEIASPAEDAVVQFTASPAARRNTHILVVEMAYDPASHGRGDL